MISCNILSSNFVTRGSYFLAQLLIKVFLELFNIIEA